jgi:hypothetical protein
MLPAESHQAPGWRRIPKSRQCIEVVQAAERALSKCPGEPLQSLVNEALGCIRVVHNLAPGLHPSKVAWCGCKLRMRRVAWVFAITAGFAASGPARDLLEYDEERLLFSKVNAARAFRLKRCNRGSLAVHFWQDPRQA